VRRQPTAPWALIHWGQFALAQGYFNSVEEITAAPNAVERIALAKLPKNKMEKHKARPATARQE